MRHVTVNLNTREVVRVIDTPLLYSYVRVKVPVEVKVRITGIRRDHRCDWWEVDVEALHSPVIVTSEELYDERPRMTVARLLNGWPMSPRLEVAMRKLLGETV